MMREMIEIRIKQERIAAGDLTVGEVQRLLAASKDHHTYDNGETFARDVTALKASLVDELRRNASLEKDVAKLDKRIALLIKNRGDLHLLADTASGLTALLRRYRKGHGTGSTDGSDGERDEATRRVDALFGDKAHMQLYAQLFYVLQTEPRYMAKVIFSTSERQMEGFLDTVVLSLFGDSISPREEYLLLELFGHAVKFELENCGKVADLTSSESVLPRMVARYARRKPGVVYLRDALGPWLNSLLDDDLGDLQLKPSIVWQAIVNEEEVATGERSTKPRNLSDAEAMKQPECAAVVRQNVERAIGICQRLVDGVCSSAERLPYGVRWVCRLIQQSAEEQFPTSSADEIFKVISYFLYYRFLNLAITSPDSVGLVTRSISTQVRKNLVAIARLTQNLFTLTYFDESKAWMAPANEWITSQVDTVRKFFSAAIEVDTPEEVLQLDSYLELAQKTKPVIVLSAGEIVSVHRRLAELVDVVAPAADDPVRVLLGELGTPPDGATVQMLNQPNSVAGQRETQLTLENRFKDAAEEAIANEASALYEGTKQLIISALRQVPVVDGEEVTLLQMIRSGKKFAKAKGNADLLDTCRRSLENLQVLEGHDEGRVQVGDDYMGVLKDIALELANRRAVRERRKAEIRRLENALAALRDTYQYLDEQINQYSTYLSECRRMQQEKTEKKGFFSSRRRGPTVGDITLAGSGGASVGGGGGGGASGGGANGDGSSGGTGSSGLRKSYTHTQLKKKGIIVESEVPKALHGKTTFTIAEREPGVFHIVGQVPGVRSQEMDLELDDLLQLQETGSQTLNLDSVTLDVNLTLSLLNKEFLVR